MLERIGPVYYWHKYGIIAYAGSDYTAIIDCDVYSNIGSGIAIGWPSHCAFERCDVFDNGGGGISLDTARYATVERDSADVRDIGILDAEIFLDRRSHERG